MISFTLRCDQGHRFDGWFKDNATYDAQASSGEVSCPHCASTTIEKAPMAPAIGRSRANGPSEEKLATMMAEMRSELKKVRRHVEDNCEYVGERFAQEARSIHLGETEHRDIYGEASDDQVADLREEGVEFMRIPWLPREN